MNPGWLLQHFAEISEAPEAVPRLRRFILDLAVRGKLVEQDVESAPASELLERIRLETARLVAAGETRLQSPLDDVTTDELGFAIPSHWTTCRLGEVAICLDYRRIPVNNEERTRRIEGKDPAGLFPYYGATQQQGWIDDFIFDEEIVLLGEDGVPFFDQLRPKAYLVSGKSWVNNHAHVFRGVLVSNQFLVHWLNVFDYAGRVAGATRSKLNQSKAIDIPMPLPPLAEQHRIVAKVDELMALCAELEAAQAKRERRRDRLVAATLHGLNNGDASVDAGARPTLQDSARFYFHHLSPLTTRPEHIHQLRETILNLAVRGKLVKQDPRDEPSLKLLEGIEKDVPFQLPETWKWVRMGHLGFEFQNGISKRTSETGLPTIVLRLADVVGGRIDLSEPREILLTDTEREKYGLSSADILVTRVNGSMELVGAMTLVGTHERHLCYCDHFIRMRPLHSFLSSRYIALVGRSRLCRDAMEGLFITTAGQKTVNQGHIASILISLPPLAEQQRIVAKVDELISLCDELESRLTTTATTRRRLLQSTLHEALEGES